MIAVFPAFAEYDHMWSAVFSQVLQKKMSTTSIVICESPSFSKYLLRGIYTGRI